jgi:Ca-activated chloride channel homolog
LIFVHPGWLAVGLVACLGALWTWRRYDERQRKALAAFLSPHLSTELTRSMSTARRRVKRALFAAAVALLFVALAEPQVGFHWEQVKRRGNDIVFAVDTSRSMLTPDVKPNRLVRAKLAIDDFVGRLQGDAVGLVAFAGSAFLQCPLTLDYGAFHESLAALDTHIIPRGGTDISSAIRAAQSALHNRPGSDKILILVTDGEDLEGDALDTAKTAFKQDGLKIYTVGVGSANGDLIPLPADQGGGFLRDKEGHFVRSRLDEPALRALAQATGGSYAPLGTENQGLDLIYARALAPLAKHDLESRTEKVYIERFQWPLAACLACLLASLMVGTRRRAGSPRPAASASDRAPASGAVTVSGAAAASAAAIVLLVLGPTRSAHASPATAASAYQRGDFSQAQRDYSAAAARDPAQPILKFDAGSAAYKAGDFPVAAREFQASLDAAKSGSAERLAEQQDAYYNLGNTLYRTGQKTERSDAQRTIETWTSAVKAYDAALQLRADDADSKFNRDLVNKKLEQLKKQQQSQSQQGQSQNKNQQSAKDQSKSSSGSPSASQQQSGQSQNPDKGQPQQGQGQQAQSQPGQSQQGEPQQGQAQARQGQGQPQQGQGQPQQGQGQQTPSQSGQSQQQAQQAGQDQQNQQGQSQQPHQGPVTADGGNPPQTAQNRDGAQNGDEQRIPGQMSPEEARELLDSVKDEERKAPTAPSAGNSEANAAPEEEPSKDW